MTSEEISQIIARQFMGEEKEADALKLREWLDEDKNNKVAYDALSHYWANKPKVTAESKRALFDKIQHKVNNNQYKLDLVMKVVKPKVQHTMRYRSRVVAMVVLVIGLGWIAYEQLDTPIQEAFIEKTNPEGRKLMFQLPDGTMVTLNADSELKYAYDVKQNKRLVYLKGEAFFDVTKDESKPFSVISGEVMTTALGTSFNVKAYTEEQMVQVALLTGKVEVVNMENASVSLRLNPGMGAIYNSSTRSLRQKAFNEEKALGWKSGIILFEKAGLAEVIKELERWYGVKIDVVNPEKLDAWRYSGKFENVSLENVLSIMGHVKGFTSSIEDKKVMINL